LIFDLVQHVAPLFCSGHWYNYFLQLGQAVWASSFLDVYGHISVVLPKVTKANAFIVTIEHFLQKTLLM
jgi:hypothetical protein